MKKGEHGVRVVTFVDRTVTETDPATGQQVERPVRSPHTTVVFHITQTEPTAERASRRQNCRTPRRSAWASGHGKYPSVDPGPRADRDPGYVDPGELAADRWNETH